MDLNRRRDLLLFGLVGGLAFYLAGALWSALFIVALPQDRDWCKGATEIQTGEDSVEQRCVEFKNSLEELKYYHNRDMADRNRNWLFGQVIAGAIVGGLLFHSLPRRRGALRNRNQTAVGAAMFGATVALMMPLILGWLLPAPVRWLPRQIVEYADAKAESELKLLKGIAEDMQ